MFEELLKSRCESKTEYQSKFRGYESVREKLSDLLRIVPVYFPHFSRHDASHSRNIIESMERLFGEDNAKILSITDILFLLLSAYAHDVGMSLRYQEIESQLTTAEWRDKLKHILDGGQPDMKTIAEKLNDYPASVQDDAVNGSIELYREVQLVFETIFREEHASRSAEYIRGNDALIDLLGIRLTYLLADICKMHEKDINDIMALPFEENGLFGDYVHPRLIASMLCFCDLLDMDTDRFDKTMLHAVSDLPKLSESHKRKHESLRHFLIKIGAVEIKADCPDYEVYRIMRGWIDWMKKASQTMVYHWDEICPHHAIPAPRIKQCETLIQGNSKWCGMADLSLHIDAKHALEILKGTNIYSNKGVFVRELLQNSVDASLIQLCRDIKTYLGKSQADDLTMEEAQEYIGAHDQEFREYEVKGSYSLENGRVKVEITDRGTGIRKEDIRNIAGLKGKSENYKKEINTFPAMLRPSGAFGLGIQSVFQVSDKIEYYTKADGEEAKHITIEDYQGGKGYVTVSDFAEDMPRGTKTVIYLDSKRFSQTDLGVSDYAFQTGKREELLLTWLIQHCNNIDRGDLAPAFKSSLQREDYFPVKIEGYFPDDPGNIMAVISRSSMLPQLVQKEEGRIEANTERDVLTFCHANYREGLIFEAEFYIPDAEGGLGIPRTNHPLKYNQSLWYRNVFVQSNLVRDNFRGKDKFFELCDFRINIMSDRADDILNIGRDKILPSFSLKLEELIDSEASFMKRAIVDCVMDKGIEKAGTESVWKEGAASGLLFCAFMYALSETHRYEELKAKYNDKLESIEVNNYFSLAENQGEAGNRPVEKSFEALKLVDKNILLASKIDSGTVLIPAELLEKTAKVETDINLEMVCLHRSSELHRSIEPHIVNHYPVELFYAKIGNDYYEICEVSAYRKTVQAVKRGEILLFDHMLLIICGSRRCLPTMPGYEVLFTDLSSGIADRYRGGREKAIEMALEPAIKKELFGEISRVGYIADAKERFLERIKSSEMYERNVRFIENAAKERGESGAESVRDKYSALWGEMLDILGKEQYAEFSKKRSFQIMQNVFAVEIFEPARQGGLIFDYYIVE